MQFQVALDGVPCELPDKLPMGPWVERMTLGYRLWDTNLSCNPIEYPPEW